MPYPPAITLRPCTLGGSTALESGTQLVLSAEITASRSLKWGATGWQFPSLTRTVTGTEGAELSFSLPVTDLAGWRLNDDSGSIIDVSTPGSYTHTYTIKLKTLSGGRQIDERTIGPFALPAEDLSPIDLDLMLPAPTVAGGVVSVPGTWDQRVAAAEAAAARAEASSLIAIRERPAAPAPLLTGPLVAETVQQAPLGYDSASGLYYGHSTANGHYITSPDLSTWTDRTYSPSTYTPSALGYEFDGAYMYAYSSTGRVWRAPAAVFNGWAEITPPGLGPLTAGRPGSLCAVGDGVLLYGNYTTSGGDGAHVWRSADAGATWAEVLTLAAAKHVHAIRRNPATGVVWCSVGDAGWPGLGLYKSLDGGLTWIYMSSNDYGIDMVFVPAQGEWPALVILEGDGLNRPHLMAFPQDGEPGEKTFPLVWGWTGATTDPLSWRGTTRGLALLPGNHLIYYTTAEGGITGVRSGVWLAEAPNYDRILLLKETTGAEPNYGRTFATATWTQNVHRRFATPTLGSY